MDHVAILRKANVSKIIQIDNLNDTAIKEVINEYGSAISPGTSNEQWSNWIKKQTKKRYCILVFLKDIEKVEPFNIDKTGYGISSAWLSVGNIDNVKIRD